METCLVIVENMNFQQFQGHSFQRKEGSKQEGQEGQRFVEVHVIFDRYIEESLKSGTRTEGAGAETVRYKIFDSTVIELLTTNQFLSDIKTKQYLTMYLSMKLCEIAFQNV